MRRFEQKLENVSKQIDKSLKLQGGFIEKVDEVIQNYSDEAAFELINYFLLLGKIHRKLSSSQNQEFVDALFQFSGYSHLKNLSSQEDDLSAEQLKRDLENLVGLKKVKEQISHLMAYQTIQSQRKANGLAIPDRTLHMAFIGNPGTGKTTVARIVGKMYKELGLLSKGHFIEVSRTDLIAGYQGQTALKVKQVIEKAKGGVLFIDEAYSITENENSDSYGRECLTELTKALEDFRNDLVVIVAGYREPMKKFFASNQGLESRFNYFIDFEDYSAEELLEIFKKLAEKDDYDVSVSLQEKLLRFFNEDGNSDANQFANGRFVRNIYEKVILNQAVRLSHSEINNKEKLSLLTSEDFLEI